jgi:predicted nucleotide-binding protein
VERAKEKITVLISQGETFTYENFSTKGHYGYPEAYSPDWVAWRTRVKGAIERLLGPNSAPMDMLKSGLQVAVLGNGQDKFQLAQSYFLGALKAASEVLAEDTFNELRTSSASARGNYTNEIFIVHGHDDKSKTELEMFLQEVGLKPIVLHRQADEGQTVIEKFEKHANVGYAFVLLTPDEIAYLGAQEKSLDSDRIKEKRARPNVIFEFGYFIGRLGRSRVCCLYTGGVILPSDVNGFLYKKFNHSIEEVAYAITKELKVAGYSLK